jgi:MFS family permease
MIGYRALALGASPSLLGIIAAVMAVPAFLSALPLGRLSDRFGSARVTLAGWALMLVGAFLMIFAQDILVLCLTGVCVSAGQASTTVGNQAFIARSGSPAHRDRDYGNYSAAHGIGQLIGAPLVTSVVAFVSNGSGATLEDTSIGIAVTAVCLMLAFPFVVSVLRLGRGVLPAGAPRASPTLLSLSRSHGVWKGYVASGAVLAANDLLYAYMPLWGTEKGVSVGTVGVLLAIRATISLLSRVGLSQLVRHFGRKRLLVSALILGVVSLVGLPLVNEWGAIPVMVGLGVSFGMPQPLTLAWIVSAVAPANHGAALGIRMMVNRLAEVLVPLAIAGLAAPLGAAGVFWASAIIMSGAATLTVRADPDISGGNEPVTPDED